MIHLSPQRSLPEKRKKFTIFRVCKQGEHSQTLRLKVFDILVFRTTFFSLGGLQDIYVTTIVSFYLLFNLIYIYIYI